MELPLRRPSLSVKTFVLERSASTVLCGLLGYLINGYTVRVWDGVDLLSGSVFSYIAVALFGPWWGGLAAAIGGARTMVDWGHPFALVLHVIEIISVGLFLRTRIPLAAAAALTGAIIGLPLVGVIYGGYLNLSFEFVSMVGLADLLSGLIAALLTHLLLLSRGSWRFWGRMGAHQLPPPSFRRQIFVGTLSVATLPLSALLLYSGTVLHVRAEERAKDVLALHAQTVANCFDDVYQSARLQLDLLEEIRRRGPEQGANPRYIDLSPGARLWWRFPSAAGLDSFPPLDVGEVHFPIDRSLPPTANTGPPTAALRIKSALACSVNTRNLDSVRIAILKEGTGAEVISFVPAQSNQPKSGFVDARTLLYSIGQQSSGTIAFRRASSGAGTFQRPAYLGGHALAQCGLRIICYQPAARAYLREARFHMWAIFLVISAATASAAFALWLGRLITAPVTRLHHYIGSVDVASGTPILDSAGADLATEMRPLWQGVQDLQRRTAAALKRSEESAGAALAATKQKSEFLATISHEIRTPLNCILGMSPLLRAEKLSNGQRDAVDFIERSGEHLVSILNNVLDFSRIEQGQLELRKEPFETVSLLEEAFEMVVPGAVDKGLRFSWICSPSLPAFCQGDPLRVKQILLNIVGNAAKFTPSGSVEIDVSWTPGASSDTDGRIVCMVRDTGPGIPEKHLDRLFQPFWQLTQTVGTPANVGTGLGLSIVKRILAAMGGEIGIGAKVGIGTTVIVSIPVGVIHRRPKASPLAVVIAGASSRIRDSLASQVHFLGCSNEVQTTLPSGSGAGASLIVEDILAAAMPTHSAGSLQSFIEAGWKVAVYQTYPLHFKKDDFCHTPGVEFLTVPPSLRRLREAFAQWGGSPANTPSPPITPAELDHPVRVLVAEDNFENRFVIELLLNRLGCQHQIVEDGAEAWAALQSSGFDFAILDLRMPGIDGLALARRIRQELAAPPKLIALTASVFESDRKLCADAGFDAFLAKPLRESDLRRVLTADEPTPAFPLGTDCVWSARNLTSFRSICGAKAEVMIRTVLDDAGSWLATPVREQVAESIAERAHKLAGSAMLIGAAGLAGALKRIEEIALTEPDELPDAIAAANRAWSHAVHELELPSSLSPAPQ